MQHCHTKNFNCQVLFFSRKRWKLLYNVSNDCRIHINLFFCQSGIDPNTKNLSKEKGIKGKLNDKKKAINIFGKESDFEFKSSPVIPGQRDLKILYALCALKWYHDGWNLLLEITRVPGTLGLTVIDQLCQLDQKSRNLNDIRFDIIGRKVKKVYVCEIQDDRFKLH